MNMIDTPIYPDIRKGPPRFVWTKKHWKVDNGRTMAEVEHIPQLQEAAVLYQSYDYGSQHAYGKMPSYTAVVNKEFRPPLLGQEDLLPLSRIPRPVIIPRINPGGAHPSGNNVFAAQNIGIPGVEKYLTNRVKEGEMRPGNIFAPLFGDHPIDNSVLPDLQMKLPPTSAGAGYKFPTITRLESPEADTLTRGYAKIQPAQLSGETMITFDAPDAREELSLEYNNPQISGHAGMGGRISASAVPIWNSNETQINLDYNRPQVAGDSGRSGLTGFGTTRVQ